MQVLKDEIRQAILKASEDEFLENGFQAASVRRVADTVGISVGNIYRYFPGKEALFQAVVQPAYVQLESLVQRHGEAAANTNGSLVEMAADALTNLVWDYRKPLLILLDGSGGTSFAGTDQKIYRLVANHINSRLLGREAGPAKREYDEADVWPLTIALMQGCFDIIRRYPDRNACQNRLRQYVSFWYEGLQAFL